MEKYAKSGSQLYVEGELETRQYKDSNDQNRIVTEVVVPRFTGSIRLVGDKSSATKTSQSASTDDFDDQF
jgi:single-strand DNA-binding protein